MGKRTSQDWSHQKLKRYPVDQNWLKVHVKPRREGGVGRGEKKKLFSQRAKVKYSFVQGGFYRDVEVIGGKSLVRSVLPVFQPDLLDISLQYEDVKL